MNKPPAGTYLAFDYGEKYIGIASGQSLIKTSTPQSIVTNHCGTPDWSKLESLVAQWNPVAFVVGIPLNMDGSAQGITGQARGFKKRLSKHFNLPSFEMDERLSTASAAAIIKENRQRGKRKKTNKADLDKIAAALILENWFEKHNEFD